ncbi:MAG: hypothetical protein QOH61_832 [Chloroflexota bacterium]|nr:hypothetical protein [Chloroflexota bacterium]
MKVIDRRQFLQMGLAAGAGVVAATTLGPGLALGADRAPRTGIGGRMQRRITAAPLAKRRMVVLDMGGGNDGLSCLPPKGAAGTTYRALRPATAIPESSMLDLSAYGTTSVGMHPSLSRIHARGFAAMQGIGVKKPDLSHFEMMRRWWSGDQDSLHQSSTGFLGRLCDVIGDTTAPAVGLSLGYGPSPALNAARVVTLSMDPYSDGSFPTFDDIGMHRAWAAAWKVMAERQGNESVPFCSARDGAAYARRFSDLAGNLPNPGGNYPDSDLGYQLMLAARICAQDNGIRVVHVPVFHDFDTHEDHLTRHAAVLSDIDAAIDAFMLDLEARGIDDRVLLVSTSEFGRRVPDNESNGLDHGAGSFVLMLGPVNPGLYGEYPDLANLDGDDNLVATVHMDDYYATLAEGWFGVPAADVIPGGVPLAGIFD